MTAPDPWAGQRLVAGADGVRVVTERSPSGAIRRSVPFRWWKPTHLVARARHQSWARRTFGSVR